MIIIGITGTLGAGKGTIVSFLKKKGFKHFSAREYIATQVKKEGLEVTRSTLFTVANKLRRKYGPSHVAEELFQDARKSKKNAVIESLRTPGEIESLKTKGNFYLFAVDASPELRYQRIVKRGSETDKIGYKEFVQNEKREMSSKDPTKQNLQKCISMADFSFDNNKSIKDLENQVNKVIGSLGKIRQ